jgi:RNA polymerase sigma factor (sigma-70 family)
VSSDTELLAAWREGDVQAGNELFQRHYATVHRFLVNKVDDELEDVLQRTFEACAKGRERFEGRSSFRSYLLGIARKLVLQHWEARRRRRDHRDIEDLAISDLGAGPSTLLARSEEHRRLLEALRRLPLRQQIMLELYFWEELTGPEIGDLLGIPEDTARSRLRRAKLRLADQINRLERSADALESTSEDLERWAAGVRAQLQVEAG